AFDIFRVTFARAPTTVVAPHDVQGDEGDPAVGPSNVLAILRKRSIAGLALTDERERAPSQALLAREEDGAQSRESLERIVAGCDAAKRAEQIPESKERIRHCSASVPRGDGRVCGHPRYNRTLERDGGSAGGGLAGGLGGRPEPPMSILKNSSIRRLTSSAF